MLLVVIMSRVKESLIDLDATPCFLFLKVSHCINECIRRS